MVEHVDELEVRRGDPVQRSGNFIALTPQPTPVATVPGAPEVPRHVAATWDSRPLYARDFVIHTPSVLLATEFGFTLHQPVEFTVPAGFVCVLRSIKVELAVPITVTIGNLDYNYVFGFFLLVDNELQPDFFAASRGVFSSMTVPLHRVIRPEARVGLFFHNQSLPFLVAAPVINLDVIWTGTYLLHDAGLPTAQEVGTRPMPVRKLEGSA